MNRIVRKVKKLWYGFRGNEDAFLKIKIDQFKEQGGKCGENFKFYCDMPGEPFLVEIGDNVTIAAGTSLLTHDNSVIKLNIDATDYFGKVKIGDYCFIGIKSIIMPGVELGERTIVGAGSVVTKSFPEGNVVICGNPAKIICTVDDFRNKKRDICVNLDKEGRRAIKREYLLSLPENMFEHK
ncbi:MAG: acyltransferase [Ruminococcus sp.]